MLRLENINKSFGKLKVLKNINLEINKGDRIVIIGPSGSGKSTLLRAINFLGKPDSGKIYFNNNSSKIYISSGEVNKYYWLFDNTNRYWTSSKYQYDEEKAWIVYGAGSLTTMYDVSSLIFGIRPVVSVLKDVLK